MALQNLEPTTKTPLGNLDDAGEFEAGLAKLMPFLRTFALSLAHNRELGEDLAQGTLAKAWQSRRSFTPGSNLKAWLFTILRNEFYSHQRRAWRQLPWDAALVGSIAAPPGEQQWAVELSDTAGAMLGLTAAQREALILVAIGGFSYKDTALLVGSTVGTVKSRVGRARQYLSKLLDSHGPLPTQSRSGNCSAMNEILAQLSHLSRIYAPRAAAGTAVG